MAKIVLEQGEEFEHFHSLESRTILLEGNAELVYYGNVQKLRLNQEVIVPAKVAHTLRNVGTIMATVACRHIPR